MPASDNNSTKPFEMLKLLSQQADRMIKAYHLLSEGRQSNIQPASSSIL